MGAWPQHSQCLCLCDSNLLQALKSLTELHAALNQSGHPSYLQQTYKYSLQAELGAQAATLQATLQTWRSFLLQLRTQTPALLFLSVRQLHTCLQRLADAQAAGELSCLQNHFKRHDISDAASGLQHQAFWHQ